MAAIDRHRELERYDFLFAELNAGQLGVTFRREGEREPRQPRAREVVIRDLTGHARGCFKAYEARRGHPDYDSYRAALWLRRWSLHTQGQHDFIFNRDDPVRWREQYEAKGGKTPR